MPLMKAPMQLNSSFQNLLLLQADYDRVGVFM